MHCLDWTLPLLFTNKKTKLFIPTTDRESRSTRYIMKTLNSTAVVQLPDGTSSQVVQGHHLKACSCRFRHPQRAEDELRSCLDFSIARAAHFPG